MIHAQRRASRRRRANCERSAVVRSDSKTVRVFSALVWNLSAPDTSARSLSMIKKVGGAALHRRVEQTGINFGTDIRRENFRAARRACCLRMSGSGLPGYEKRRYKKSAKSPAWCH
jgi:hypothetical protein